MDTRIYEINAYSRQDMIHNKSYMVNLMDGKKPEAAEHYRAHPAEAAAGFTFDEKPVA